MLAAFARNLRDLPGALTPSAVLSGLPQVREALARDQLSLHYQVQTTITDGRIRGYEALLRWNHPEIGEISPTEFIPLAEHSGLIISLGAWVLRTSCFTMRQLLDDGHQLKRMGVNVSAIQFRQPDFMTLVQNALRDSGLDPHYLELEITETVTMNGAADFEETLDKLKKLGVQIAIDDFGTGFSSLSYLDKLPVDRLKIDRAFVTQIDSQGGPRIAELITQLGKKLGLQVIAEGIETQAHYDALLKMECDEGQGFLIARPMLESAIGTWLTEWK